MPTLLLSGNKHPSLIGADAENEEGGVASWQQLHAMRTQVCQKIERHTYFQYKHTPF